jgi:OmpA-OmpF porin, OOP family
MVFLAIVITQTLIAQEVSKTYEYKRRPTIGIHFTLHDFVTAAEIKNSSLGTVLNNGEWYKTSRMSPGIAISFTQGLSDNLDYMARLGFASVEYPIPNRPPAGRDKMLLEGDFSMNLKMLSDRYVIVPYISAGVGASLWSGYFGAYMPVGLGLNFNIFREAYVLLQSQYRIPVTSNTTASHLFYSFGIQGSIPKKKVVIQPQIVIAPPAPKDTDGDGIVDSLDACPTVYGIAQFQGCPDTDKDGIQDSQDKCPTVPGLPKYQGCPIPDTDGDGINDEEDKCPTVPGLPRYQGCPIPDTDGDGVNDEEDKCPNTPGVAANLGCPEMILYFKRADAVLNATDKMKLDTVVVFLNNHPEVNVTIEGHTSTLGATDYNQKLSERRAASSVKYLISKGIAKERLSAVGYGEQYPIGDNSVEAGRAASRRVVIKVKQ